MNKQAHSRKFSAKQSARLGAYLAAGLGAAATSTADAAIVNINIGPSGFNIGGVNAGLALNSFVYRDNFPLTGANTLLVYNGSYSRWGLNGYYYLSFANGGGYASPSKFSLGDSIGSSANWNNGPGFFQIFYAVSPNFGSGSYMGFRTAQNNYGWLEVTWDSASQDFEILSGAYEDQAGVAILAGAGAGPAAVPEPGTWACRRASRRWCRLRPLAQAPQRSAKRSGLSAQIFRQDTRHARARRVFCLRPLRV
jgi:hypothetical protein